MKRAFALILLACLSCTSSVIASTPKSDPRLLTADERTTVDEALALAKSLVAQKNFREAALIYSALQAIHPGDDNLVLAYARMTLLAGDTQQALSLYDKLVLRNPHNTELRLEAARAHYATGSESAAMRLGGQVLADYEKQRFQIHGIVRVGVLYDTNATEGPSSDTMDLGEWRVRFYNISQKSSLGAYAGFRSDLVWRLDATGPWWLVGDVRGFWRGNTNSDLDASKTREWQAGRVAAGLCYMDSQNLADLRAKSEVLDFQFSTRIVALGAEFRYTRVVTPWLHLVANTAAESRTYNRFKQRDGAFGRAGGYARFFLGGTGHEFHLGASCLGATARKNDYSYGGWQGLARFNFQLPHGFTLSPSASLLQEFYNGPGTFFETRKREDTLLRLGVNVSYAISKTWSIEAGYHYTNAYSTCNLFKFDQHVTNLGVAWKF